MPRKNYDYTLAIIAYIILMISQCDKKKRKKIGRCTLIEQRNLYYLFFLFSNYNIPSRTLPMS